MNYVKNNEKYRYCDKWRKSQEGLNCNGKNNFFKMYFKVNDLRFLIILPLLTIFNYLSKMIRLLHMN